MKDIKKKIKAVIFDMDGTIIDTDYVWEKVIKDFLAQKGVSSLSSKQKEDLQSSSGGGLIRAATLFKSEFNFSESVGELVDQKIKLSLAYMAKYDVKFINGFKEFHQKLSLNKIPSGIATNADLQTLNLLTKKLNFEQFFGANIYSMDHVGKKAKPDPTLFLHTAKKLNVSPGECVVFEDSISGFLAAKKAGIRCIAIKNDGNKDLLDNVDYAIEDYNEAEEVLNKL